MIAAYRHDDRSRGRHLMQQVINSVSHKVPTALTEITTLGRTLKRHVTDILAYFDRPGTSEAINGRLEHLRGSALGFRNLTNYIARSLSGDRRIQTPTTPPIMGSSYLRWV